jgi:DNA-directed RNA polymerase subunit RPC12/RpoP
MVDIVVPKCPRCGADIELRPDGAAAVCKYCDAQVLVLGDHDHGSQSEMERRKEAIALLRQDLSELERQASQASIRIQEAQSGGPAVRSGAAILPVILFSMMIFFSALMTPLFYFLQITWVYGVSPDMCLVIGIALIIIGVAGIIATRLGVNRLREGRRARAMQSPEYYAAVQEQSLLEPRLRKAREDLERAESDLRALVLGPQGP